MTKYNGHKNRNHRNVSLWINNTESIYNEAVRLCKLYPRDKAARKLLAWIGNDTTWDGAPYTFSSVRAALVGIL